MPPPKPQPKPAPAPTAGFSSSFGELLRARGLAPAVESTPVAPAPTAQPAPAPAGPLDLSKAGKLVVRREMKGRGGKTVTLVEGLPASSVADVMRALKSHLGCGATLEGEKGDILALQGDQTDRTLPWLNARGARQVVRGN